MTEDELIAAGRDMFNQTEYSVLFQEEPFGLKQALEILYLHGFADDVTGDVASPDGHVYRIDRWVVRTTKSGYEHLVIETFDSEAEAIESMVRDHDRYTVWVGHDG